MTSPARNRAPEPQIGATVVILDARTAPQVATYLGRGIDGRHRARPALGGTWHCDLDQIIA